MIRRSTSPPPASRAPMSEAEVLLEHANIIRKLASDMASQHLTLMLVGDGSPINNLARDTVGANRRSMEEAADYLQTLESQTMLTLIEVRTGIQQAVATGSARKKDLSFIGGGALTGAGIGALGGAYTSTDMGKITSLALLDAFRKITTDARTRLTPPNQQPLGSPGVVGTSGMAAAPVSPVPGAVPHR